MVAQKKRIVTVFGSSHMEENFPEYQRAVTLGRILAENGFVVCSGGYGGIMEAVSRGAKQVGGPTVGIISSELSLEANRWVDKVKVAKTWKQRLFKLIESSDAFVVFDGGTGTMTELFSVWEMLNKRLIAKPLIIHGAYMINFVRRLKRQRLVLFNDFVRVTQSAQTVIDYIEDALEEAEAEED